MAVRRRLQRRRRRNLGVPRRIQDRSNPLEGLNDNEIFERYRFFPATIFFIVDILKDNLQFTSRRNNPLTPLHRVLVSLRFFATGSFYITIGDTLSISKSTAGRAVRLVTELLCRMTRRFIRLPSREEFVNIKAAFYKIAGIWLHESGVLGASPDGLVPHPPTCDVNFQTPEARDAVPDIVEVKCPYSAAHLTIYEAVHSLKDFYLEYREGFFYLKSNHPYFHQIQGQLHLCNKNCCDLIV